MKLLSSKQKEVLRFVVRYIERERQAPTLKEIGDEFHVVPETARKHLRGLEVKGCLRLKERSIRAIAVTEIGKEALAKRSHKSSPHIGMWMKGRCTR